MPRKLTDSYSMLEILGRSTCVGLYSALALLLIGSAFFGCEGSEPRERVVLYVSADEFVVREVVSAFERESGIAVDMVGDTEARKTTGLVERLRAEQDNPQADVFWSSEIFMTIALANEGVLAPHHSNQTQDWPTQYRDEEGRWYGFAARARVIVYPTDRLDESELPATWMDLVHPRWQGRIVMADPRFGTTGGHLGAMKSVWDNVSPDFYTAYVERLADNGVRLLTSGNAGVVRAVASGEADLGMTDTDDVWVAQANGLPVGLIYAAHDVDVRRRGTGTLLIPNTVGRVAGGPNSKTAAALIDFLLSEQVERILAESDSRNVPLRPGLASEYPELDVPNPLQVDFYEAAAKFNEAVNQMIAASQGERSGAVDDELMNIERSQMPPRSYTVPDPDDPLNDHEPNGESEGELLPDLFSRMFSSDRLKDAS